MSNELNHSSLITHSVRNDFTGLAIAAFTAWKLTVNMAINKAITPAKTKTHQPIFIRYAKSCNHLFPAHHAIGEAIRIAMPTSFMKSFDNNLNNACYRSSEHLTDTYFFGALFGRVNT